MNIYVVTGKSGSGKTTFCREMVQQMRRSGLNVNGLLSLPEFEGADKKNIQALDTRTGQKRLLASDQRQTENDLIFGKWFFNPETLDWGNKVLSTSTPCDLLVIDELGPLELKLSQGWIKALDVIKTGQYQLALVVIRPELLKMAGHIFHPIRTILLHNVAEVPDTVFRVFSSHRLNKNCSS